MLLLACFVIIQISHVSGISGSYSSVSGLVETVKSHPDAVISDDVLMNNGARIPPTLTWKENKLIKVSLNTTHGCITLYFTGFFASGFISEAVLEKSAGKKDQTYNLQRFLWVYFLSRMRKTKLNTTRSNKNISRCFSPLLLFWSLAPSKTLILSYYLAFLTQPYYCDTSGIISVVVFLFPFAFVCFSIFLA